MDKTIHICSGLPGAGKTTYCREVAPKKTISVDDCGISPVGRIRSKESCYDAVCVELDKLGREYNGIYLDGLFLTEHEVIELLTYIQKNSMEMDRVKQVMIDFWIPDRANCLLNDMGRVSRLRKSENVIKNASVSMDIRLLEKAFPELAFSRIDHYTKQAPEHVLIAHINGAELEDGRFLCSQHWCIGGYYSTYTGAGGMMTPDEQPVGFTALEDLLEKICPDLPFPIFLQIMRDENMVWMEHEEEAGYYGGHACYSYYKADLEAIVELLHEKEMLTESIFGK